MSYSKPLRPVGYYHPLGAPMPYPLRGLGDEGDEHLRYGRYWELICFPGTEVSQLVQDMNAWNAAMPGLTAENQRNNDFVEEANPVRGLKILWIRLGKNDNWWPGAKQPEQYNFGPTTYTDDCPGGRGHEYMGSKPANTMRVDQEFWKDAQARRARVKTARTLTTPYPDALWRPHSDGYVRLREDDPLLKVIRDKLVYEGYLAPQDVVSTKDNSRFVGQVGDSGPTGLKRYFLECARQNLPDCGNWPGGISFGPNTSGNELRVHPRLLFRILNSTSPRTAAGQERAQTVLRNVRVKPPIFGGLPPVLPSGRTLDTPVSNSQLRVTTLSLSTPAAQALRLSALKGWIAR